MRAYAVRALALCVAGVLAVACGGGSDDRAQDVGQTTTGRWFAEPEIQRLTEAILIDALLTINDMPTGWAETSLEQDTAADTICGVSFVANDGLVASARKTFSKAAFGPFFTEVIDLYEPRTGELVFESFADALGNCQGYTDTDLETGNTTVYNVAPLSFPKLGDATVAVRITSAEATLLGVATFDVILIRKGEVILFVGHISVGFEGPDSEANEALTRAAYQRMQSKIP